MRVTLKITLPRSHERRLGGGNRSKVWKRELDALGYPVASMVKYAKWRFNSDNYRPHVVDKIQGEYDVPYAVANQISIIALDEMEL